MICLVLRQSLLNEDRDTDANVSKRALMLAGARRHLEAGHEKYILDTIHNHPTQVFFALYQGQSQGLPIEIASIALFYYR